jgi:hypothetical protein
MIIRRTLLVFAHAALATAIIGLLYGQYDERHRAVAVTRHAAEGERRDTEAVERENRVLGETLNGIKASDPYVVEMLARDRLGYQRPGEMAPPPLPAVDKAPATLTK